ncbi:hypothetical protein [Streptomyces sp. NPDC005438]|uniref:hypothetical protein n=1 Tax=Streptomyces sp. NPDC005438 TaxID=3156880 RepID=UPI0033A5C551
MRRRRFLTGVTGVAAATVGWGLGTGTAVAAPGAREAAGWGQVTVPTGQPASRLTRVAAVSTELAWAVGESGRNGTTPGTPLALRWDGDQWTELDLGHLDFEGPLTQLAASSPESAWALGGEGESSHLLRWEGDSWRETAFPDSTRAGTRLIGLAVADDGTVWASGERDGRYALLRGTDGTFEWLDPLPEDSGTPYQVRVGPAGAVWVSGDVIARWDQGSWTVLPQPEGIRQGIGDLLAPAPDDVWVVGASFGVGGPPDKPTSAVFSHWDGTGWTDLTEGLPFRVGGLYAMIGDADHRPDLVVGWDFWDGHRTHYLRRDGDDWVSERGPDAGTQTPMMRHLAAVPGTDQIWSVGSDSRYSTSPPALARVERYG